MVDLPTPIPQSETQLQAAFAGGMPEQLNLRNWIRTMFALAGAPNTLKGDTVGILGNNIDCTYYFNKAIQDLKAAGGGILDLPAGTVRVSGQVIIDGSGITIRGYQSGRGGGGTILKLDRAASGPKVLINAASRIEGIVFHSMHIQGGGHNSPIFGIYRATNSFFFDLTYSEVYHLFKLGNEAVADEWANEVFITEVRGNMKAATSGPCITMPNFAGGLNMQDFAAEGSQPPVSGSCGIRLAAADLLRVDGLYMDRCGFGLFDRGLDLQKGGANWFFDRCLFDRCGLSGIFIATTENLNNFKFCNGHVFGWAGAVLDGAIGVFVQVVSSGMYDILFSGNTINFWGGNGAFLHSGDAVFIENFLTDVAQFADNTVPAMRIGAGFTGQVSRNTIRKQAATNDPNYGILIEASGAVLRVQDNDIRAGQTALISNSNRGSAQTRRVTGNTGQVFEGKQSFFGGFHSAADIAATGSEVLYIGDQPSCFQVYMRRRGRVVSVSAIMSAAITSGTATVSVQTSASTVLLSTILQNGAQGNATEDLDGVAFNAGIVLEMKVVSASLDPTTLEVQSAGFTVEWD